MRKEIDVTGLGDLMIDFSYAGEDESGRALFARNPAGSMANVLCQVAKLGGTGMLVTTLGNDAHSRYLYETARALGLDTSCIAFGTLPTRFMFEYRDENNDRYFDDYRCPRTEAQTRLENVDTEKFKRSRFFDIKAIAFRPEDSITQTEKVLFRLAEENDVTLAIDMQWRGIPLPEEEKAQIKERARRCGVLKLTDEELAYYFGGSDIRSGVEAVFAGSARAQLVAVTMGRDGSVLYTRRSSAYSRAYDVPVVDTTGAGDSFMGALLYGLSRRGSALETLDERELAALGDFCNACASFSTMSPGSLLSMGTAADVQELMRSRARITPAHSGIQR